MYRLTCIELIMLGSFKAYHMPIEYHQFNLPAVGWFNSNIECLGLNTLRFRPSSSKTGE